MTAKYYKPEILTESPVLVDNPGYSGQADNAKDGFIPTTLEQDVVIQRISKDLYSHPTSGIRELYANEARACRTAKKNGAFPEIRLSVNRETRKIVLEGIDSSGMSWETFRDVYCVLGRSTNFDGTESGQFGFGRAAYMCISDIMILETYCRETGEKYAVMGKSGIGFQTGLPTPKMESFGTRVTLTANEDIGMFEIMDMVRDCARLSGVRTVIEAEGYRGDYSGVVEPTNLENLAYKSFGRDAGDYRTMELLTINGDEVDVVLSYAKYYGYNMTVTRDSKTYLCGIPITHVYKGMFGDVLTNVTVNVKNERKYQPTPDRERLRDEAKEALDKKIDEMASSYIKSLPKMNLKKFMQRSDKGILSEIVRITETSGNLIPFTNAMMVKTFEKKGSELGRIFQRAHSHKFLVSPKYISKDIEAIRGHDPNMQVFKVHEDDIGKLTSIGVQTTKQYMKEHKIKPAKATVKRVRLYKGCSYDCTEDSDKIPQGTISATPAQITKVRQECHHYGIKYPHFGNVNQIGKDNPRAISFEQWLDGIGKRIVSTNHGVMNLEQVKNTTKMIVIGTLDGLTPRDDILAITDDIHYVREYLFLNDRTWKNAGMEHINDIDKGILSLRFKDKGRNLPNECQMKYLETYKKLSIPEVKEAYTNVGYEDWGGSISEYSCADAFLKLEKALGEKYGIGIAGSKLCRVSDPDQQVLFEKHGKEQPTK